MKKTALILSSVVCVLAMSGCVKKAEDAASATPASAPETDVTSVVDVAQPESPDMDAVLVTVEGESLNREMAMNMAREMAARQGVPPQMLGQFLAQMGGQFEQQAIDQFISQTLVAKEAERRDVPVSDEEIDAVIADISKTLPEGVTLDQALQAQNMTEADLRKNIASSERMRKLYEEQTADATKATDEMVATFYTENAEQFKTEASVTASHILIACDDKADEAAHAKAKAEAEALLKELQDGADFAEMAKAHSSCPSKEQGGSLGSFSRGRMVPEFEEAAFTQEIGKVGNVVKTPFGYHIILVTDRAEATNRPLEEVSDDIRTHLNRQEQDKLFKTFLDGLREKADITYPEGDK